ncbi:hypothetical protein J1605_017474 [Eschrichtius robustus]|uniref:Tetrahydrofolate dehydrogenase/cyclohydrolase catalytic domain-containing protein n=1 Tax=Eschrichtius robustus TaxID=9764 RepID=A0AB34HWQ5_ESCRO|nr:hypothetical protein J1605_017474 [Eschrichtius robustus]
MARQKDLEFDVCVLATAPSLPAAVGTVCHPYWHTQMMQVQGSGALSQACDDNLMQEINQNLAEEAGLNITHICLPADSGEDEIIDEILKINEDTRVHGLALQISETSFSDKILNALKPEKDVDG